MRPYIAFSLLLTFKALSRLFYRFDSRWVGEEIPADPWAGIRIVAFLNHTSLFEPLFVGAVPNRILWQLARWGLAPGADKTLCRPVVGRIFKLMLHDFVSITRRRDDTWTSFLSTIDPRSLVILAPEGRMKRANGLDLHGRPMTVRGGIADVLEAVPRGRMVVVYSGGLHHVQIPGQAFPKLFKKLQVRFETLDTPAYCKSLDSGDGPEAFKSAVIADLENRRDRYCQIQGDFR